MLLKLGDGCSRIVQYASYLNGDYYEMVFSRDPLSNQEYLKSSLHYSIIYFHILKNKYCTTSKITGTSNRHCNSLKITSIYYTQILHYIKALRVARERWGIARDRQRIARERQRIAKELQRIARESRGQLERGGGQLERLPATTVRGCLPQR